MSGLPSDCTAPPHSQNYPYFKPGEKGWRDCVSSCLMNNSFFQTLPDAPNLWRLVDAKRQSPTPKVRLICSITIGLLSTYHSQNLRILN